MGVPEVGVSERESAAPVKFQDVKFKVLRFKHDSRE